MISSKLYKIIPLLLGVVLFFIFNVDNSSAQSTDTCASVSECTAVSACEIDNYDIAGDVACGGSWNFLGTYCSGIRCVDSYICDSSCSTVGQQVTSASCSNNWCSYTTGGPCSTNLGQCWWNEERASSDPISDGPTTLPLNGNGSTCSDPNGQPIISYPSGSSFTVSQGDLGWVGLAYTAQGSTVMNVGVPTCPAGATCNAPSPTNNDGDGFPPTIFGVTINNTSSLTPGTYPIDILLSNTGDAGCNAEATVFLTVEPSRQTVCNGSWYTVTGSFAASQNPVGKYFSTPATINVFAPNASTGRNIYEQICTGATALQSCSWNSLPGWTNIGLFSSVVNQPVHIPSTNFRNAIVSTQSNGMYQLSGASWNVFPGPAPAWGTPASAVDPFNRTYSFRRGGGNVVEYMCSIANAFPDITATPTSVISGGASTISWTSTNATSCAVTCSSGSCPWTGTSGSQSSGALVADRTYTLTCQPGNTTDAVTVTVSGGSGPSIGLIPATMFFSRQIGQAAPATSNATISNSGAVGSNLNWRASTNQTWCTIGGVGSPGSITGGPLAQGAPGTVRAVGVPIPSSMPAGSNLCAVTVSDNGSTPAVTGGSKTVAVTYNVLPTNPGSVSGSLIGVCPARDVRITWTASNGGGTPVTYNIYRNTVNVFPASPLPAGTGVSGTTFTDTTPAGGTTYYYWVRATAGGQNSSPIAATQNATGGIAVPVCAPIGYRLNVTKAGQGTVSSTQGTPAISCGSVCQADYDPDEDVTLQATAAPGRIFTGWSGSCSGRGDCDLTMNSDKSVTANFAVDPNYKEF